MIKAIIYKTNTGYTMEYAKMLSEELHIPCYEVKEAGKHIEKNDEIIYLGWICAGRISGYSKTNRQYHIKCCGAVGIYPFSKEYVETLKRDNQVVQPLFYMQGGINPNKLNGFFKKILNIVAKSMEKENKAEYKEVIPILKNGGSLVSKENVKNMIEYVSQ